MQHSLLDMVDRFAMTFGNLALLAALPVAAFALIAHAL
jgi:cyanate permease